MAALIMWSSRSPSRSQLHPSFRRSVKSSPLTRRRAATRSPITHTTPEPDDVTARTVLFGVLQHRGASKSATQTMEAEYQLYGGIDRLAAELETIAADAQHDRFVELLGRSGLTTEQHGAVVGSGAFGPLTAALRRAEAYHHDLDRLVPKLVAQHGLDDADDIAAVLRYRVEQAASGPPRGCRLRPRLIARLIPEPLGEISAEDRQSIDEPVELIESRALTLVVEAVGTRAPWIRRLGGPQPDSDDWMTAAATVAAYRDRYDVTSDLPTGGGAKNEAQRIERQRALRAAHEARQLAAAGFPSPVGPIASQTISVP